MPTILVTLEPKTSFSINIPPTFFLFKIISLGHLRPIELSPITLFIASWQINPEIKLKGSLDFDPSKAIDI